jgi:anion-transporting  ArsA/GET3 family ATPase
MSSLTDLIAAHRVIVCVGSGGVGKTTTAASLALWGTLQGRRTAVVTIDPSKRLADCLGLHISITEETTLSPETFARYGLTPTGTLTALLVDQQSAWDAAIARYAPTIEIRDHILANRFYQGLSQTFAGSHEYMALDALATLSDSDAYDLIVLDTPPVQQALDFLDAPARLQRFLDSRTNKWLMRPAMERGWATLSIANRTINALLHKVEEATGISALREIAEFFATMHGMFEDFGSRFKRVSTLLSSKATAFVLVTNPDEEILQEAENFRLGLEQLGIFLKGIVANRVHTDWQDSSLQTLDRQRLAKGLQRVLPRSVGTKTIKWLVENFQTYQELARSETLRLEQFSQRLPQSLPFVRVPILHECPVDLRGLCTLHSYFFEKT